VILETGFFTKILRYIRQNRKKTRFLWPEESLCRGNPEVVAPCAIGGRHGGNPEVVAPCAIGVGTGALPLQTENPEIPEVAEKFILANCYNPQIAGNLLARRQCQVSETQTPHDFVDFTSFTILNKNLNPL
jgi:hypothetical protein